MTKQNKVVKQVTEKLGVDMKDQVTKFIVFTLVEAAKAEERKRISSYMKKLDKNWGEGSTKFKKTYDFINQTKDNE